MKYLIGLAVAGLVVFLVLRRREAPQEPPALDKNDAKEQKQIGHYRAVSIKAGPNACEAAMKLEGKRLLPNEVGAFPLEGCDKADCHCKFEHHSDRREEDDRRESLRGFGVENQMIEERRKAKDRRSSK